MAASVGAALNALSQPQVRNKLVGLAKGGMKALGRSRRRRANRGRYYVGKRLGIPPNRSNGNGGNGVPTFSLGVNGRFPRRGGANLMQTTTTTRAPNLGQSIRNQQTGVARRERGVECNGNLYYDPLLAAANPSGFHICFNTTINPAEPSLFPALSAISNQYQRFRTGGLGFQFTPSSSTTVSGQVYMAFVPDVDTPEPTDVSSMISLFGCVQGPIYGSATRLMVNPQTLQQAYNVQQIHKNQVVGADDTTLNASGRLFVAVSGCDLDETTVIGTLSTIYNYELTTRTLRQGSNEVTGYYRYSGLLADFLFASEYNTGHHIMMWDAGKTWYRIRSAPGSYILLAYFMSAASGDSPSFALTVSNDGTNWTAPDAYATTDDTLKTTSGYLIIPPTRFVRVDWGTQTTVSDSRFALTSLAQ